MKQKSENKVVFGTELDTRAVDKGRRILRSQKRTASFSKSFFETPDCDCGHKKIGVCKHTLLPVQATLLSHKRSKKHIPFSSFNQ